MRTTALHLKYLSIVLMFFFTACSSSSNPDPDIIISGATLIDGTGRAPILKCTISVTDGVISDLSTGETAPVSEGTILIQAEGKFVMPGIIDGHVHFTTGGLEPLGPRITERILHQFLFYGVTTVLNLGGDGGSTDEIVDLRNRQRNQDFLAPRIYGTGNMLTIDGGHPIATTLTAALPPGTAPDSVDWESRGYTVLRDREHAREFIANHAALSMDGVKIIIDSGPPPWGNNHPRMSLDMVRFIVDEAHQHDMPVYAHISSLDECSDAVNAGVRAIAHGVMDNPQLDEILMQTMKDKDVFYIPTLALYEGFHRYVDDPSLFDVPFLLLGVSENTIASLQNPYFLEKHKHRTAEWVRPRMKNILRGIGAAHSYGVKIALGTDSGSLFDFPGFSAHLEMELLEKAGLTPMEVIIAATRRGAELLGAEDVFGTVEVGKRADLIILDANPFDDIRNTRKIDMVIHDGEIVPRDKPNNRE